MMEGVTQEASFKGDPPVAAEREMLPDRRELALVAVERTRMPMVMTDPRQPDNPIVLANAAFLELTGYPSEEVLGRNCRFLQGPDTNPSDIATIRRALEAGEDHFEIELLNYRKDGTAFWNQLAFSRVTDDAGELLYYFASQKDVTARRRAEHLEQAERLLLKEVDHRAMNALALVQSFVNLGDAENGRAFAASVRGRVSALARAHRALAESGWRGLDLRQLLVLELPEQVVARIRIDGEAVELATTMVQPLALTLHKLASNALQHGSLSSAGGKIDVTWSLDGNRLSFDWSESGPGGVLKPTEIGIGFRILEGLVKRQLGGELCMSWDAPGLQVHLRLPLAATDGPSS